MVVATFWCLDDFAQNKPGMGLPIKKAKGQIVLDGKLDETDWTEAEAAENFFLNYPVDTASAPFQTKAKLIFDDHNLYVAFVCYDDNKPHIVQSLRRDFDFNNNDNVTVLIGPYNDKINGFFFTITPYNVQMEGTINSGGSSDDGYSATWDNKWYSKITQYENRWEAEIMIPFKSFRYKHGEEKWNINFLRWDRKHNLVSTWIATPIQYPAGSFAYSGFLEWKDKVPQSSSNISVIPYLAGFSSTDREVKPVDHTSDMQAGFDAKVGVTPSLNLDLTVNPDFSQVEVDQQVINLTRFEYRFPERRQFFLENSDLYDRGGFPDSRPFFSRRIGLAHDSTGVLRKVPIAYGARLSGSLSKNWRISTLNMQTKEKTSLGLPAQNYTVAAVQRNFWKQSNITLMYVDKESLHVNLEDSIRFFNNDLWKYKREGEDSAKVANNFNRVLTADLDLRTADNRWYSSFFYSRSFDPFNTSKRDAGGAFLSYTKRHGGFIVGQNFVNKNYNAEVGFVPSKGVYPGLTNSFVGGNLTFYPKKIIATMGPGLNVNFTNVPSGVFTDRAYSLIYNFSFLNTARINIGYNQIFQRLTNTFNPIDEEKFQSYYAGEEFTWHNYNIVFLSDQRKVFRYSLSATKGGFYNGNNTNLNGEMNIRFQPFGSVSLRFDYNDLRLPDNYGKEKLVLIRPRFDFTLTDKLFLATTIQYNSLADNINLNARFQWRYKPASDFFIVYTENYLPGNLSSKNRALVFKFTYWFNI